MFTLKLYQNGPLPPNGRTIIVECAGIWIDHGKEGIKHIHVFKKKVGVMDEDGCHEFYVGGDPTDSTFDDTDSAITKGVGGNYFGWGVLENALGKTTEMLR